MNNNETREQRLHPHRRHWLLIILAIIICCLTIFLIRFFNAAKNASALMYKDDGAHISHLIEKKKPISILLLGIDTGADGRVDRGNSDTMIVLTLNPKTKTATMISVPRDTLAQIVGVVPENMQKINAAYNIGSSKMAKATVSRLLNVPINYYATMNMGALEKIVNDVGGVTVNSKFTIRSDNDTGSVIVHKGKDHLNGYQTLVYVRMRHQDPLGDYGRQQRQRQVIEALLPKLISFEGLLHYQKIMNSIASGMQTDLNFNDIVSLVRHYRGCRKHIISTHIQGKTAYINGSSYQIAPTSALQSASDKLRKQLDLEPEKLNNAETRLNALNPLFFANANSIYYDTYGFDNTYY